MNNMYFEILYILACIIMIVVPLLIAVAYLTLAERKVIGLMQRRTGPNIVGPFGLLQPFADAIKLLFKETIVPSASSKLLFILAPMITFVLALIGWAVIPFDSELVLANINVGVLYIMAISSLEVYAIIIAGWASNSKYAFLGAIRSSAQMISYEVSMGLVIVCVLLTTGSLNLIEIVERSQNMPWWLSLLMFPMGVVFFISILAETNRHPFDLAEAESELVAGYNVEYSSMAFALFFLGEYANMILVSAMCTSLFMGGYYPPFGIELLKIIPGIIWFCIKVCLLLFTFLWIRATLPRYRYDQLMDLGWKFFLPLSLFWVVMIAYIIVYNDMFEVLYA
ncbi:MAG: NADH-quinone oxidoreductase subunit NuoH [Rickettsiaceae bacterium]|nr:NADH-quinone oxidoreductase subunit NuoH [Rickettsiaceae bacterium]